MAIAVFAALHDIQHECGKAGGWDALPHGEKPSDVVQLGATDLVQLCEVRNLPREELDDLRSKSQQARPSRADTRTLMPPRSS